MAGRLKRSYRNHVKEKADATSVTTKPASTEAKAVPVDPILVNITPMDEANPRSLDVVKALIKTGGSVTFEERLQYLKGLLM